MPLKRLAASTLGLLLGCVAAQAQVSATAPTESVTITASTSGCPSGPCTVRANCPANQRIISGYFWFIVPDGIGAAYGICGSASGICVGAPYCEFKTYSLGCAKPGWNRQMGFIYATCN